MIVIDRQIKAKKVGNFLTLFGIADTHFLCDNDKTDKNAYQPLDHEAYLYMQRCMEEVKKDKEYYGDIITYTAGDLTELERSSTRKVMRALRKNDTRAQDTIHKNIINHYILKRLHFFTDKTDFIGGVAGNHLIEFSDNSEARNSEEYIINRLGGKYCGEGKLLLNLHVEAGNASRHIVKILITHGLKAASKQAIINELQKIYYQYGKIDVVIKAHAHDPMAGFYCKYDLPDREGLGIKKHETLVVCLGSTRDGEKIGYDDYSERFNYAPHASRFPVITLRLIKTAANNHSYGVKIRPLIM